MTLARRFPVPALGRAAQVRIQLQLYNVFNAVQFTTMNTTLQFTGVNNSVLNSTQPARYTAAIPPREFGITARFDF
jgi:hypothetical protein